MRFALVCCPNPLCNCSTPTSLFCKIKVASTRSQCYKIRASFFEFENASFQRSQSDHLMFIRSQVSVETISVKQMIKTSQHRLSFYFLLLLPLSLSSQRHLYLNHVCIIISLTPDFKVVKNLL